VGRQYIGEIGKTDNGIVVVTTHLYDGKKSLPLDIELYQHGSSLPQGKEDEQFKKKPELALELIEKSLGRGYQPGIIIVDGGYGNNTSFLIELEKKKLFYLGGLAKNRKVIVKKEKNQAESLRIDKLAESLPRESFTEIKLNLDKPKTVWVATIEVEISALQGKRSIGIVMNASTFKEATNIDYLITNVASSTVTPQWLVSTYSQRNWVEVLNQ
jgi:DDE superfamily endonuclease